MAVGCDGWMEQEEVESSPACGASSCPPRSPSAPPSGCTGSASSRHRPATSQYSSTRGWSRPPGCGRPAGVPTYDNPTALGVLLEEVAGHHALGARRLGKRDATIGAAGAAVAVVGTAALVRRARKKRR